MNAETSSFGIQKSRPAHDEVSPLLQDQVQRSEADHRAERKAGKTHFVEHRSAFHLYHSFHRLWIFLVCMLQVGFSTTLHFLIICTIRNIHVHELFETLGHQLLATNLFQRLATGSAVASTFFYYDLQMQYFGRFK